MFSLFCNVSKDSTQRITSHSKKKIKELQIIASHSLKKISFTLISLQTVDIRLFSLNATVKGKTILCLLKTQRFALNPEPPGDKLDTWVPLHFQLI